MQGYGVNRLYGQASSIEESSSGACVMAFPRVSAPWKAVNYFFIFMSAKSIIMAGKKQVYYCNSSTQLNILSIDGWSELP